MIVVGPLWFVNFSLVGFFIFVLSFLGFYRVDSVKVSLLKQSFSSTISDKKIELPKLDLIIEKDIFNTIPVILEEEKKPKIQFIPVMSVVQIPNPPAMIPVKDYINQEQDFLPPLQLAIKGTIISNNPKNNRAFIENVRSKEEKSYIVGDRIDDAQIVFIGKSKVIFVRANGQQESIYISKIIEEEEDAISKISWNNVVKSENGVKTIDLRLLINRINSVGAFLDELGLVTYFNKSIPIGCIVSSAGPDSLAYQLGLLEKDIITKIDNISTATQDLRISIYQKLLTQPYEKPIELDVDLIRNGNSMKLRYNLFMSTVDAYRKNFSILNMDPSLIKQNRSNNKEQIIKEQVKTSEIQGELEETINNQKMVLAEQGSKRYALYRQ
jgi:type II secretory pathway component PulC